MATITTQNNKTVPMTKETFVKAINDIKGYHEKINKIQTVLEETCYDSVFWPPSLESTLITVLKDSFNDEDGYGGMIEYFIYELEYGEQWNVGTVTDENGNDIKLATAEDLYDYLVDGLKEII